MAVLRGLLLGLAVLLSGCGPPPPSSAQIIAGIQAQRVLLEQEAAQSRACHARSMQVMKEVIACIDMPWPSAEQDACYAALSDQSAFREREPLDCRKYNDRMERAYRTRKKAADVCFAIYPDASPSNMEEFSACMNARLGR